MIGRLLVGLARYSDALAAFLGLVMIGIGLSFVSPAAALVVPGVLLFVAAVWPRAKPGGG